MKDLICPVCTLPLNETNGGRSLSCEHGHLFDKAKQGYLNLLLSQNKKSKHPGDTVEMVAARTRFLDQGYYAAIAAKLIQIVNQNLSEASTDRIRYCDIACGEGYYTHAATNALKESKADNVIATGFDISTPAIKAAVRRNKAIQWLVASANKIPLAAESQSLLSCLFCRVDYDAAAKVAAPGAKFIVVETGPEHLVELRRVLYDTLKPEPEKLVVNQSPFRHLLTETLADSVHIASNESLFDLLTMTPHFWRVKPEKKLALKEIQSLDVTLDVRFHVYEKSALPTVEQDQL